MRAETQDSHFLVGVRQWGVEILSPTQIKIYSEAYEQILSPVGPVPGIDMTFKADQTQVWGECLMNTVEGLGHSPRSVQYPGVFQFHSMVLGVPWIY